jgi:hypothetical protein
VIRAVSVIGVHQCKFVGEVLSVVSEHGWFLGVRHVCEGKETFKVSDARDIMDAARALSDEESSRRRTAHQSNELSRKLYRQVRRTTPADKGKLQ